MSTYEKRDFKKYDRRYLFDLGERVGATFVEAFLALWTAPIILEVVNGDTTVGRIWQGLWDFDVLDKAFVGALAAVFAVLKGLGAKAVGSENTAALLPVPEDTTHA